MATSRKHFEEHTEERALTHVPAHIQALGLARVDEYIDESDARRRVLRPDVVERWTRDLHPDDYTLSDIVDWELRRLKALSTLRRDAELTDLEFKFVRYLQRRAGKITSYLLIARHLWQTSTFRVTARHLQGVGGYASSMVGSIHVLASNIRRKLEIDPIRPQHLATVRGVGYVWYDEPPSLDDGVNYEQRATQIVGLQRTMHALIGDVSEDAPVDHQLAAQVGLELEARPTIDAEYRPVEGSGDES